ncbi:MAG: branched-chain amino acid transporter permease [Candidatus Fimadaptatus sp.]
MNETAPALNAAQHALTIFTLGAVTLATRAVPFLAFSGRRVPRMVLYLGRVLPPAIMAMLVVYCLKDVNFMAASYGLPELIACALVIALHLWRRNALISIFGGTAAYMLLIQCVFA